MSSIFSVSRLIISAVTGVKTQVTRRSREHLRSGKDRKMAGIMVAPESAAGTGAGVWDWRRLG